METVSLLTNFVEQYQFLAYALILVGIIFEGEVIVISAGILTHLGALNFWVALVFIFLGGMGKTILGYALGRLLYQKFNHNRFFCYIQRKVHSLMPNFQEKPFWSIFISKFIIGANHAVILFSGYERIDYKKYLKAEIFATAIWAPLLLSLGYFFSYTALHVSEEIWRFSMIVLVLLILFFIFDKLASLAYEFFEEIKHGKKH